ncbi:elongation factor EF-G, partial [Perkinsus olseni]
DRARFLSELVGPLDDAVRLSTGRTPRSVFEFFREMYSVPSENSVSHLTLEDLPPDLRNMSLTAIRQGVASSSRQQRQRTSAPSIQGMASEGIFYVRSPQGKPLWPVVAKLLEELKGSVDKLHVAMLMRELSRIVRRSAEQEGDATLVVDVILQHALSKYPYASEVAVPVCEIFRHYALVPTMRIFFIETAVDAPYISVLIRLASGNMAFPHKADARLVTEVVAFLANLSSGSTYCDIGTWTALDFGARDLARRALKVTTIEPCSSFCLS